MKDKTPKTTTAVEERLSEKESTSPSGFDLDAWKHQGEKRIEVIDSEVGKLEMSITECQGQIDNLQSEKLEIQKALGQAPALPSRGNGHAGKVMIRPILMELFVKRPGEALSEERIIEIVQEDRKDATAEAIRTSLARLVKTDPRVAFSDNVFTYTGTGLAPSA